MKKYSFREEFVKDSGALLAGSFLFSMALNQFLTPAGIILGGVSGLAVTVHTLLGLDVGLVILLLNLPLLGINLKLYGLRFCTKTIIGTIATSLFVDLLHFFPITMTDPLLCTIFGSITMGIGTGILFGRGFTTGGTDHLVWIVRRRHRNLSAGRIIMISDVAVVLFCALLLRSYESIFYSALGIYLYSFVLDAVQDGFHRGDLVWIISEEYREISRDISEEMGRGMTLVRGYGWYSGKEKKMLLCALRKSEFYRLRAIVTRHDPNAFLMVLSANQVLGEGFQNSEP